MDQWLLDRVRGLAAHDGAAPDADARARVLAAYGTWARSEAGRIMLDDMIQTVLLQPCEDAYAEGQRRFVLRLLKVVTTAAP